MQYDWFFNHDETVCIVHEAYTSSAAVQRHAANLGDLLGTLIELGGGLHAELFGSPSEELMAALAAHHPAVYPHFQGK